MVKPAIKKFTGVFPSSGKALAFGICLLLLLLSACGAGEENADPAGEEAAQREALLPAELTETPSPIPSEPAEESIRISSENYLDYYEFRDDFLSVYDADGVLVTRNADRVLALREEYQDRRISSDVSVSYEVSYNARLLTGFDEDTMSFQTGEINEPAREKWKYEMRDTSATEQSTEEILCAVRYRYWYPVLEKGYLMEGFTPKELTHYFSVLVYPETINVTDISGILVLQPAETNGSRSNGSSTP